MKITEGSLAVMKG